MSQRTITLVVGVLLSAIPAVADFAAWAAITPGSLNCTHMTYSMSCTATGTGRDIYDPLKTVDISGYLTTSYADGMLYQISRFRPAVSGTTISWFSMSFSDAVMIRGYSGSGFVQFRPIVSAAVGANEVILRFYFTGLGTPESPLSTYDRGTLSPLIPFDSGTFDMSGGLYVQGHELSGSSIPGSEAFLYADIYLYDSNMQPLTGYSFEYASDVPEPNSWALSAAVLSAVVLVYQRKRSRQQS